MRFLATPLEGVWVSEPEPIVDERGSFARTYDAQEFQGHGLDPTIAQCNSSFNALRGTLRGMHYQAEPHGESKLVRCVRGAVFDVALDLRPRSATYMRWHGVELSADNGLAMFMPQGIAHGFQTLSDASEVTYQMGHPYVPGAARGVRYDDPAFAIAWPERDVPLIVSERDASFPDFAPS
jgi:dTDP-4-dehydrorhamnose 3,5-epimerase